MRGGNYAYQLIDPQNSYLVTDLDASNATPVEYAQLKGLIVYVDKVRIESVRLNLLAKIKDFLSCSQAEFVGQLRADSMVNTRWGLDVNSFNIRKLSDDMYYMEPIDLPPENYAIG